MRVWGMPKGMILNVTAAVRATVSTGRLHIGAARYLSR
jgi:hypothetical protein